MTQQKSSSGHSKQRRHDEKQTRYLSQAIQLEEAVNPHIIKATMTMISFAILAFLAWAGFTNINEVARAAGEVVPQGYQQTVQHLEGGIVKSIGVHEGDSVQAGQTLVTLDDASIRDDMQRLRAKQNSLEMEAERLRAFIEGRKPDFARFDIADEAMIADQNSFFEGMLYARERESKIISEQLAEKRLSIQPLQAELEAARNNLKIAHDVYARRAELNAKGYSSDMQLLQDQREINTLQGQINRLENQIAMARTQTTEYQGRLESLSAGHRDVALQQLSAVVAEMQQNIELINKLEERIGRLQVRSPADGVVKGLSVNTIGSVIQSGQTLMEIVPLNKNLEVSVKISPQDIGHLEIGQTVQVKFSSFDFSRYGSVQGKLDHISATTFSGENGGRYYQGRVLLDQDFVGVNPKNKIVPGMTVMADVVTGEKTILQYLLKPIHVSLKTAFTER